MQKANDTGSGVLVAEKAAEQNTAAHLPVSPAGKRVKRDTGNELTARDRLQILQQAIVDLRKCGILATVANHPSKVMAILALEGIRWCPKCQYLYLFEDMIGQECKNCSGSVETDTSPLPHR